MKFKGTEVILVATILSCLPIEGARILAVLPLFAGSHHRFSQPLLKALARAGHEVVVYSPFPLEKPHPNYTDFYMDNVDTNTKEVKQLIVDFIAMKSYECLDLFLKIIDKEFNDFIESDHIQKLLISKQHFDLVITEPFTGQEFTLILGHIFKAPVIGLQAFMTNNAVNSNMGNSLSIAHIPDPCSTFSNKMSFFDRLRNLFYVWRNLYYVHYYLHLPIVDQKLKQYFPDSPPILEMINNMSLVFVNDHLTVDYAQPRTPNIIPVAGIHIEEESPLPKEIKKFMDEAKDGVILFSLGTYVNDEYEPRKYFDMYNRVFSKLKQRVLWKSRKENILETPENVMTLSWAPQRDILAHPNCVLFITHGGLLSQHEAVYSGVPVVVIPQFYDQHRNSKFYEEKGIGVRLHNQGLTELTIMSAIKDVLENPKYKNNIKRLSKLFKDRPMTPEQTVVYWTEYVLRHGGAPHLKPASTQLSWYQLALLDVLAVILAFVIFAIAVIYLICKFLIKHVFCKKNTFSKIKKKSC